ncbi:MAG: DUF177 domain-containing protein [Bacteroidota bacterium]|nr:DUF177 domain-containing protein [Bacteroidota bacterium]
MLREYLIPFVGLKLGKHQFDFQVKKDFFEAFSYTEFEGVDVQVDLVLDKKTTFLECAFSHKGKVRVPCDVTGELFDLPIEGELNVIVQFGEEYNDDNEELLILPHGESQLNVAQYIYEMIVLSVPYRRVSVDDEQDVEVWNEESEEEKEIDPRWEKLKELLNNKK